jgi:hypothetical protein
MEASASVEALPKHLMQLGMVMQSHSHPHWFTVLQLQTNTFHSTKTTEDNQKIKSHIAHTDTVPK